MADALSGIPIIRQISNDFVAYDATWAEHVLHVNILQRCTERGITSNSSKFMFGQTEIEFGGYIFSQDGYRIHPDLTASHLPWPSNRTDLRSFFCLANQLSTFTDEIAKKMEPLRDLLKQKTSSSGTLSKTRHSRKQSNP